MTKRFSAVILTALLCSVYTPNVTALTMTQFAEICHSSAGNCGDHPILQAYVGGALDLLATLDEQTEYLEPMYCKAPKELFDVPEIIQFMMQRAKPFAADNAMLVLIRYFEEHGACERN